MLNLSRPSIGSWVTAALIMIYVAARALNVQFTIDESSSWLWFHEHSYERIFFLRVATSNNHVLNTLLMKLFGTVLGPYDWALRLPALIGAATYFYFSAKMSALFFRNPFRQVAALFVMALHPYLLEFMGLARGYALSAGFEMAALYHLFRWIDGGADDQKRLWNLVLCALGAVWANLGAFNFLAAMGLISLMFGVRHFKLVDWRIGSKLPYLFGLTVALFLFIPQIWKLARANELYFGGERGVFQDTIRSMAADWLYRDALNTAGGGVTTLALMICAGWLLGWVAAWLDWRKRGPLSPAAAIGGVSLLIWVMIFIQFYGLGSKLPLHRTTLYLYPLWVLSVLWAVKILGHRGKNIILGFLGLAFLFQFGRTANLAVVKTWPFESYSRQVLETVERESIKDEGAKTRLIANSYLATTLEYYRRQRRLDRIEEIPFLQIDLNKRADWAFVAAADTALLHEGYVIRQTYGHDGAFLLMKYPGK